MSPWWCMERIICSRCQSSSTTQNQGWEEPKVWEVGLRAPHRSRQGLGMGTGTARHRATFDKVLDLPNNKRECLQAVPLGWGFRGSIYTLDSHTWLQANLCRQVCGPRVRQRDSGTAPPYASQDFSCLHIRGADLGWKWYHSCPFLTFWSGCQHPEQLPDLEPGTEDNLKPGPSL